MGCIHPDCLKRAPHSHHVVYEQELQRRWDSDPKVRETYPRYSLLKGDVRNLVDMCQPHHFDHHGGSFKIEVVQLSDDALTFSFEILGPYAYDYIKRRYRGDDPRLELHLAAAS